MSDRDCENCKHHTDNGCDSWDCEFERKVTRKEAIKVFEDMKKGIYPFDPTVYLDIAINSLEIDERYELEYENAEEIHREKEQAYTQGYEDACKKYRQEPKTGHWIYTDYHTWCCSECGGNPHRGTGFVPNKDGMKMRWKYCNLCGARMEVEE